MRLALACALVLATCGGSAPAAAPSATSAASAPSPNYLDLMMGAAPEATVFVVSGRDLLAVTLLNHFVRYRLPVAEEAQVATSPDGARLYVVDQPGEVVRLRRFDVLTGELRAERREPLDGHPVVRTGGARGAVAVDQQRVLVLRAATSGLLVHAYDAVSLQPLDTPAKNEGCAQRILASAHGYALVCLGGEGVYLFWDDGARQGGGIASVAGPLVGAAMSSEGRIATAQASGDVHLVRPRNTSAERFEPRNWVKAPLARDGIAWADEFTLVIAEGTAESAIPRIRVVDVTTLRVRLFDISATANGILAWGPFAYWVDAGGSGIYHVDLASGLVERMFGPLEKGASLGALAVR